MAEVGLICVCASHEKKKKVKKNKQNTLGEKVEGIWRYIVMLLESSKMKYRVARSVGYQSMKEREKADR